MKLAAISLVALTACARHNQATPPANQKEVTAPARSEAIWSTFDAGDGISVELPLAGVVTDPSEAAPLNVGSRTETGAGMGVKILRRVFSDKMGSALRELTPDGGDAHATVIAKLYGAARASGQLVTENFRGAFADDPDARGGTQDDGKNLMRFLFFRRGDDLVMVIATSSKERGGIAKPDIDRFFRSLRSSRDAR
jgi:hypothetical protein